MRVRVLAACLLLASLGAGRVRAQTAPPEAPAPPTPPPTPVSAPLPLTLSLGDSQLDPEAIRRAVELELKRPVALAKPDPNGASASAGPGLTVAVHADHSVSVSYRTGNGVTRTRSIGLPRDDARAAEVIALLSGNLSRDEAAELLAGLAAKGSENAEGTNGPPAETPPKAAKQPEMKPPEANQPPAAAGPKPTKPRTEQALLTRPYPLVGLTLAHPIGLVPNSERYVQNGELGLVYSRVGQLRGVGLNVMVLRTERDMTGLSFATFYNGTGGNVLGVPTAGLVSTFGDLRGCGLSGIANIGRNLQGCQISGIGNHARDGRGFQVAGIVNIAGSLQGFQFSGITNVADQIAGAQIGLVNVAGEVRGVQIGVVNVAKHVDGAAIGLVSVAGNGRAQPVLWTSTFMPVNAAFKFMVSYFYSQIGGGYRPNDHTYSFELGLGAHLPVGRFFLEPGVHYSEQHDGDLAFSSDQSQYLHYQLRAGLDLHAVSPFVAVAVRQRLAQAAGAPASSAVSVGGLLGLAFF